MVCPERPTDMGGIACCILLAGALKPSELVAAARVSVLDLFLTPQLTVLGAWLARFGQVAVGSPVRPEVRVLYCDRSPEPKKPQPVTGTLEVRIERDQNQFRGPAGAVKDGCGQYAPSTNVLIAEAARYLTCDITPMFAAHSSQQADITVGCNPDSSPAGLFLVRCSTLGLVPSIGFVDIKEQWLTRATSAGLSVRTHWLAGRSFELRTREQFLEAARVAAGVTAAGPVYTPEREDAAVIVDSVVMPGATIGPSAVVARSMICAGATVAAGATVVDEIVAPGSTVASQSVPGRPWGRNR